MHHADGPGIIPSDDGAAAPIGALESQPAQQHQVAQIWKQLRNPVSSKKRGNAEDYALTECALTWIACHLLYCAERLPVSNSCLHADAHATNLAWVSSMEKPVLDSCGVSHPDMHAAKGLLGLKIYA